MSVGLSIHLVVVKQELFSCSGLVDIFCLRCTPDACTTVHSCVMRLFVHAGECQMFCCENLGIIGTVVITNQTDIATKCCETA